MTRRFSHIGLISFFFVVTVFAQPANRSSVGGLAGAPMRMGFGARGAGMGNALIAVTTGDLAAYYNPALLPLHQRPLGMAAYSSLSLDRRLNFLSYGQSLKPSAGIAFGIINAGVSDIEGRDRDGIQTDTYSTSENAFMFSFGLLLDRQISVGITAKLLYFSLFDQTSSSTLGLDAGVLYQITEEMTAAFVLQDINSKYVWDTSKLYGRQGNSTTDRFPLRKRLGFAYAPLESEFVASAEIEFLESETFLRFGSEVSLGQGFAIRAGAEQVDFSAHVDFKPSMGLSFQSDQVSWHPKLSYAYVFEPYSPSGVHMFSISVSPE